MEGPLATVKLTNTVQAVSKGLAALILLSISPGAALALWPMDGARWNADMLEPFPGPGRHAPARTEGAHMPSSAGPTLMIGEDVPDTVCELVGGMYTKDRVLKLAGQSAADLLEDGSPVSTGMGYDLGPNLRFQGVGVFDTSENYASLGPAFRLNIHKGFEITTGMQLPITETAAGSLPDLYYAEFTLLF